MSMWFCSISSLTVLVCPFTYMGRTMYNYFDTHKDIYHEQKWFFFLCKSVFLFCFSFPIFNWSLIYKVVLVSNVKWFSYTYIHIYILFQIIFYYRLLQDIEYSSLCYIYTRSLPPYFMYYICIIFMYFMYYMYITPKLLSLLLTFPLW